MLTPALPILPQEDNKIHSLYSNLHSLPDFRHKDEEEYELQLHPGECAPTESLSTYPVYCRKTLEKYNFCTREKYFSTDVKPVNNG